jgi:hypothetical protein
VYWANLEKEWVLAEEPISISKKFYENSRLDRKNPLTAMGSCPAFNNNIKNLYGIKSIYDYSFSISENGKITSNVYNQDFFDSHVVVRSIEEKMFSFHQKNIFFTNEKSLPVTFYEFPVYEDNNITQRCKPVSGVYDIGKWFRPTEFAFFLNKNCNTFVIEKDEIYMYIKFHTNKKIKFQQFRATELIKEYVDDGFIINGWLKNGQLENYYKHFKNKKLILKEIKNNLL